MPGKQSMTRQANGRLLTLENLKGTNPYIERLTAFFTMKSMKDMKKKPSGSSCPSCPSW